jgi:archaeosine-15-forming tRNA-guanine transglycosylase
MEALLAKDLRCSLEDIVSRHDAPYRTVGRDNDTLFRLQCQGGALIHRFLGFAALRMVRTKWIAKPNKNAK